MSRDSLSHLADHELLRDLRSVLARDRETTAELLAHLAEVDARRLHLPAAYPSMFAWCVGEMGLSEDAAAKRIQVARLGRRFPAVFAAIAAGRLHLSGAVLLAPHMTPDRGAELLDAAAGRTKAAIGTMLAGRFPGPDVPVRIEALVTPARADEHAPGHVVHTGNSLSCNTAPATTPPAHLTPLAPERYALQFTVSRQAHDLPRSAQALLGRAEPARPAPFRRRCGARCGSATAPRMQDSQRVPAAHGPADPTSHDIASALRTLGFRADAVRRGLGCTVHLARSPIEQRLRAALPALAPRCVRIPAPGS